MVGVEVRRFIPFVGRKGAQAPFKETRDPRFTPIVEIVDKAAKLWTDCKVSMEEGDAKRKILADSLLEYLKLNPDITSSPEFYKQVHSGYAHLKALRLLSERFIPSKGKEFDEFMRSDVQGIIKTYLQGVVDNSMAIGLHIQGSNSKGEAISFLRAYGIPQHYADKVYPEIGLTPLSSREPLPIRMGTFQRNV